MQHQHSDHSKQKSSLVDMIAYITRTDNLFVFYEYYTPGHSPLEIYNQECTPRTDKLIPLESQDKIISSEELVRILGQLLVLEKSGTKVESTRIPLISSEYKFKGYRQVKFSYKESDSLHEIIINNKKKEICFNHVAKQQEEHG